MPLLPLGPVSSSLGCLTCLLLAAGCHLLLGLPKGVLIAPPGGSERCQVFERCQIFGHTASSPRLRVVSDGRRLPKRHLIAKRNFLFGWDRDLVHDPSPLSSLTAKSSLGSTSSVRCPSPCYISLRSTWPRSNRRRSDSFASSFISSSVESPWSR